jgi:hypothetical protein
VNTTTLDEIFEVHSKPKEQFYDLLTISLFRYGHWTIQEPF